MSESGPVEAKSEKSASAAQKAPVPVLTPEGAFEPALATLAHGSLAGASGVLPHVDDAHRSREVGRLQATHGNAFVSRLLSPAATAAASSGSIARVANGRTPTSSPDLPVVQPDIEPSSESVELAGATLDATGAIQSELEPPEEPQEGLLEASAHFEGDGHDHADEALRAEAAPADVAGDSLTLDATGAIQREPEEPAPEEPLESLLDASAHFDGDGHDHSDEKLAAHERIERQPTPSEMQAMDRSNKAPAFRMTMDTETLNAGQVKWSRHPQFPTVLGQTYYAHNSIELWPAFKLKYDKKVFGGYTARPDQTDAAGGIWDAVATPESETGYKLDSEHPKHPGYELFIRVTGAAANLIAGAEQQHINDLDTGWALTGLAARDAINQSAAEDPVEADDQMEARKAAVEKVVQKLGPLGTKIRGNLESGGRLESGLGPLMDNSFVQSKTQRDDTGKHTLNMRYVTKHRETKQVLYEIVDDKPLDATPSATVVNIGTIGG